MDQDTQGKGERPPSQPEAASEAFSPAEDLTPAAAPPDTSLELVRKLQEENRNLTDQLLRKQAELENLRKRAAREKDEFLQFSLFNTVKSLLPVLDGFELAIESNGGGEDYRRGVALIYQQLCATLEKLGLKAMEAKGQEFDPHLHEAVALIETQQFPDHQIVEEIQRGYYFKQRLLRPALVKVARRPASGEAPRASDVIPE